MADNWTKLKWRLQAVANNEANGGCSGIALIHIDIFLSNGLPILWQKPQRISLEPQNADVSILPLSRGDWNVLMHSLTSGQRDGMLNRTLVVKNGEPLGWLEIKLEVA